MIEYEIKSLYRNRKFTDDFSCENDHKNCEKKCELGIVMSEMLEYDIIGA